MTLSEDGNTSRVAARRPRRWTWVRAGQGLLLAMGAPLGWLAVRAVQGAPPLVELSSQPLLYVYLLLPTAIAFGAFGVLLGLHEQQLLRANLELGELSVTDELTGLKNVRYFRARLQEEHATAVRTRRPLAVAMVDLDRFKFVNDRYGHPAGDQALRQVADAIMSAVRHGETAARVGGEEFALLLPDNDGAAARVAAERIRAAIGRIHLITTRGVHPLAISASIGVASTRELPGAEPRQLYQAADDMLYRAKQLGRNRVEVADSSDDARAGAVVAGVP
jgi:diguanylate cyclase (GGDEF)-like protein